MPMIKDPERPLAQLAHEIAAINRANGWFESERSINDELMLIVGEVAEAHEEDRKGKGPAEQYYSAKLVGNDAEDYGFVIEDGKSQWFYRGQKIAHESLPIRLRKPEGIPSEMADIIIRVLDVCYRYDIDIDTVLAEKLAFNATRGHRHGGKKL